MAIKFYDNGDMLVTFENFISSTATSTAAGSTQFIASSTGISVDIWSTVSTGSTGNKVVSGRNLSYTTVAMVGFDTTRAGNYYAVIQSSEHSLSTGTVAMAILTIDHSGLDDERRLEFAVQRRGTT